MSFAGGMRYVVCGQCGDAVAGKLPSGDEPRVVTCSHCQLRFGFEDGQVRFGPVRYDEATDRWHAVTIADKLRHQPEQTQFYGMSARRFVRQAERRIDRGRNRRDR
jgi:hypothetical protein